MGLESDNWKTVLKAGDGLTLTDAETEFFKSVSGGREPPSARVREEWWVVGRRGCKDPRAGADRAQVHQGLRHPHILSMVQWQKTREALKTKDELRAMLRQAVENTQPEPETKASKDQASAG